MTGGIGVEKRSIMKKWKKHAVIPALLAAIGIISAIAFDTFKMRDDGTFYIQDLQGSRETIRDITFSGELKDGYHRTRFRIEQGEVRTRTELFKQPEYARANRYSPGAPKQMGETEYEVHGSLAFEITSREIVNGIPIPAGVANVTPGIFYSDSARQDNSSRYTNPLEYGLAKVGDRVFFTVPVSADFQGASGIYELNFYEWGRVPTEEKPVPRKIAEIGLEANQSGQGSGLEILGMEAVGSKLAVLIAEDNRLKIRGFDSESGEQLGEAVIPEFRLVGRTGDQQTEQAEAKNLEVYHETYTAFVDPERNILNLSFNASPSEPGELKRMLVSFDFSDGVRMVNKLQWTIEDGDEDNFSGMMSMGYRDGKLYVLKTLRERDDQERYAYDILRPKRFLIYAFEGSELIYKGELKTDLNDDIIRAMNLAPARGGFSYDQKEYRFFDQLKVE